jgi:P-type Mg2+ transporter
MSVLVEEEKGLNTLICKGAVEKVLSQCTWVGLDGEVIPVEKELDTKR